MRDEVNQKYNTFVLGLNKNDATYEARKQWYQAKKEQDHDSIDSLEARLKKNVKKKKFRYRYQDKGGCKFKQDKMVLEFNCQESASIKSFVIKCLGKC